MSSPKDVYWMASPLAIDQRNDLNEKKIKGMSHVAKFIDPKNEVHVFRKIQHWTLEIDGRCYELSPDLKKKLPVIKKTTDMIKPLWTPAVEWHEIRESKKIEPERRKIEQTTKTHDEIWVEVQTIWTKFNDDLRVAVEIPDTSEGLWDSIPDPVGYRLAEGAQIALAGKVAAGTKTAYLGAVANGAPAAGTGQGVGAAGTMDVTSGSAATGGTAGSGTAAAGSTGTAATGSTTAGGTTAGSGAVTSGHVGIGSKAAALMHGGHAAALGSHATALGGGMAKVGAVAAMAHPVTGLAMTGGLAYLAIRGKRGKRWSKKNKKAEDMDVLDLLEGEDEALEQVENPEELEEGSSRT